MIERFYDAFGRRDGAAMEACYAPDVHFSDPVFVDLRGAEAGAMWRMLTGPRDRPPRRAAQGARPTATAARRAGARYVHPDRPPGHQRRPRRDALRRRAHRRPRRRLRLPPLGAPGARDERAAAGLDAAAARRGCAAPEAGKLDDFLRPKRTRRRLRLGTGGSLASTHSSASPRRTRAALAQRAQGQRDGGAPGADRRAAPA